MKIDDTKRYERLLDRYRHGSIDRRRFLGLLGWAAAAYGLSGLPVAGLVKHARAAATVRYDDWGGIIQKAFDEKAIQPFMAETGINVVQGSYGGMDEFLAKVQASAPGEYNLFHNYDQFSYLRFINLGFGTVLDEKKLPNMQNFLPSLIDIYRNISGGTLSAVPFDYGIDGIGYNTNYIDKAEIEQKGVHILNDSKYEGRIGGWDNWQRRIIVAALQTGQNSNDIQDMDAIWEKIREQRGLVLKYWSSGAEQMSLFASEEIWVSDAWAGRILALQNEGRPIGWYIPEGANGFIGSLMMLKGSPMDEAHELLNFMLQPEVAVAVSVAEGYPVALDPAKVEIPEAVRQIPGFDPTGKFEHVQFAEPAYWLAHADEWQKKYRRVVSRG